jgi:hypothetical protein
MIDVYLPLPLAPVNKNQDPHVLFRLGTIPDLIESGQKFRLRGCLKSFEESKFMPIA